MKTQTELTIAGNTLAELAIEWKQAVAEYQEDGYSTNDAEASAWNALRVQYGAFGFDKDVEEKVADLLAGEGAEQANLPYAVLQINGHGIQQGKPGDVTVYSQHLTFEEAEALMLSLSARHDDRIYDFNVGQLQGSEYLPVEW